LFTDADVFAGTERHMLDLAVGLRELALQPSIACPSPSPLGDAAAKQEIPVVAIPKRGRVDWRAARILVRLFNENRIDLVHAHNGRTALCAAIAVTLARRGAFVATQHFLHPGRAARRGLAAALSSPLHQWMGRRAGGMIAVSRAARAEMLARRDADPDRITVIPHGIALPPMSNPADRAKIRRATGVAEEVPLVLCAARLEIEKDILSLVRAMSKVVEKMPQAICLVAGEGSQRGRIEQEIARLGLESRLRLLGFCADMAPLFIACDVFVLPSVAEPFGLVLLEAMSYGRVVIATRAGGPVEIVSDGETGLLVSPGDPSMLASAILSQLSNKEQCSIMGQRGRALVLERFSVHRMARATAEVYDRAVRGTSRKIFDKRVMS
jgi:glycosyltransferase involved in cell wall biosynthesis